tara:strand:- start:2134 stop:2505 length:372 start_codon:yes stop_codon:yes gene_type:complete
MPKIKKPNVVLNTDENILLSGGGGTVGFMGAKGGSIFLSNSRIFHESLFKKNKTMDINLDDISSVKVARFFPVWFILFIPLTLLIYPFNRCVKIELKNGDKKKINVTGAKKWVSKIQETIISS